MGALLVLGGLILVFVIILAVVIIPLYLLMAFGLNTMAKNAGLENTWLAFIPIANLYLMGQLIKEIKISTYVIPNTEYVLPGVTLVTLLLGRIEVLGGLLCLCNLLLFLVAYYQLYSLYRPEKAKMYTVFSILCVTVPFFIFMMRNDAMVVNLNTQGFGQ